MSAQTGFLLFLAVILCVFLVTRLRPEADAADTAITAAVNSAIAKEFPLGTFQIDVKTFAGVVILGGFTREYDQAKRAVDIASGIPGVKSVDNRITIRSGQ